MDQFLDLPYVTPVEDERDRFREFDLYIPRRSGSPDNRPAPPVICFIHGGAWRSEDKADHSNLAQSLATYTGCPVAVPNYRLTPRSPASGEEVLRHPAHAEDVLRFLAFLLAWPGPTNHNGLQFDPSRLFLVGHSCSAHMLAAILLDTPDTPSVTPTPELLQAVKGAIFSEGIYDIDLLLKSFPDYRDWFIANAFGDRPSYADVSVATLPHREGGAHIRYLIIHSKGDTLVDQPQSEAMYGHLVHLDGADTTQGRVVKNWGELEEDHNDILRGKEYVRIVGDFVLAVD
ncbi:alpha/beta-hydrolase [Dentipellis sp. KUC8613]|nr:alpha/beta-hydrolase [Dentipellis sp. KUC8613]